MRRIVQIALIVIVGVVSFGKVIAQDDSLRDFAGLDSMAYWNDSVDARSMDSAASGSEAAIGDINCNGIPYEIADAVMFSNCFIYGLAAFGSHVEASMAATDTNKDGDILSVADFVYLIRVIVGDALPYDRILAVTARVTVGRGVFSVDRPMGAASIILAGDVSPTLLTNGMEMKYAFNGKKANILIYSLEGNSFQGDFLIADGNITRMEFGGFGGQPVNLRRTESGWELHQNYPNPFNLSTTIKIDVPVRGLTWELSIFNVTGQRVQSFSGVADGFETVVWDAESKAAGVYFYQLRAGGNVLTRKMLLLK